MDVVKTFYVYIIASVSGTLYTGVTNSIRRRMYEHKNHLVPGFTDKHNIDRLLYVESFIDPNVAIKREKQIKGLRREKKIKLIDAENTPWNDLSANWFE